MRKLKGHILAGVVGALSLVWPAEAALLEGQTVETTFFDIVLDVTDIVAGPMDSVAGPGVELTNFAALVTIDFSDTNILITAVANNVGETTGTFHGLRFLDVDGTIPAFTAVTINPATNFAGFTGSLIDFNDDNILVNLATLPGLQGQVISLDLAADGGGVIPEPGAFVLMVSGFAGLAMVSRRRRKV